MLVVRERYEKVVLIYDEVQFKVSEDVWEQTYRAKMVDVETKKSDSETKKAKVFAVAQIAVEEHESIAVPRTGEAGAAGGTS